jgi:hypothetical protein
MMSAMILIALALTHFSGQMNLPAPTWLWLAAFVGYGVTSTPRRGHRRQGGACGRRARSQEDRKLA